jgi:hypothetical protein
MLSTSVRYVEQGTAVESSLGQTELWLLEQALFSSLGLIPVKVKKESPELKEESPTKTETERKLRAVEYLLKGLTDQAEHQAPSKFQQFIDALFPLLRDLVNELNQILSEEKKLRELSLNINIVPATNLEIQLAQALGLVEKKEGYFHLLLEDAQPAIPAADPQEESLNRVSTPVTRKWILMDVEKFCDDFLTSTGSPDSSGADTPTPTQFAQTLVGQLTEVIREVQQLAGTSNEQQSNKVRSPLNQEIQNKLSEAFETSLIRAQAVVLKRCSTLGLSGTCTNKVARVGVFEYVEESFRKLIESLWAKLASGTSTLEESGQNPGELLRKELSERGTEFKPNVTQGGTESIKVRVNNKEFPLETYIDYLEAKALQAIQELGHILPIKQGKDKGQNTSLSLAYFALMVSGGYMTEEIFENVAKRVIPRKNPNDQYYTNLHRILREITAACTQLGMLGVEANLRLRGIQNLFLREIGALDPLFTLLSKLGSFATPDGVELLNSLLKETVAYTVAEKIFEIVEKGIHLETSLFASADCSFDTLQVEDIAEIIKKTIITSRKGLFSLFWKFLRLALKQAISDQTSKNKAINRSLSELSFLRVADIVRMAFKGLKEEDQDLIKQIILSSRNARHVDPDNPDGQILFALRLPGQERLGEIMFKPETEEALGDTPSEESPRLPHDIYSIYKGFELAYMMAALYLRQREV